MAPTAVFLPNPDGASAKAKQFTGKSPMAGDLIVARIVAAILEKKKLTMTL
jgi:hypothetical protein